MRVDLKDVYKGQLGLRRNNLTGNFEYILTYYEYPDYDPKVVSIEDGDELVVRRPDDSSIVLTTTVDLDYETNSQMDTETGRYHQFVSLYAVDGLQRGIEPMYWFSLFTQGMYADLTKHL